MTSTTVRPAELTGRIVRPGDAEYSAASVSYNLLFTHDPLVVVFAQETQDVVNALAWARQNDVPLRVRSGGHCLEGFVSDPEVRVIIDISPMKRVYYDAERQAVAVEAGATVGETFRALFDAWGVVVPLGEYPAIGMGGHVVGGAFGFLCRQMGLAAD